MGKIASIWHAVWIGVYISYVSTQGLAFKGIYPLKTVDQCYGHQIPIICPSGSLVQIDQAYYRQAQYCPGDFHSNFCSKEEESNPACIGNQTCVFTTPWVYLSQDCGYSNNFMVTYRCIPENDVERMCSTRLIRATKGYIASPNYPNKYTTGLNCALQILAPRGYIIRIQQLDLYLTYYNFNSKTRCIDRLWITDGTNTTGYLCSGQKRKEVFTSRANKALIKFISSPHNFKSTKGFWLFYEAIPATSTPAPISPSQMEISENMTTNSITLPNNTINGEKSTTKLSMNVITVNDIIEEEKDITSNNPLFLNTVMHSSDHDTPYKDFGNPFTTAGQLAPTYTKATETSNLDERRKYIWQKGKHKLKNTENKYNDDSTLNHDPQLNNSVNSNMKIYDQNVTTANIDANSTNVTDNLMSASFEMSTAEPVATTTDLVETDSVSDSFFYTNTPVTASKTSTENVTEAAEKSENKLKPKSGTRLSIQQLKKLRQITNFLFTKNNQTNKIAQQQFERLFLKRFFGINIKAKRLKLENNVKHTNILPIVQITRNATNSKGGRKKTNLKFKFLETEQTTKANKLVSSKRINRTTDKHQINYITSLPENHVQNKYKALSTVTPTPSKLQSIHLNKMTQHPNQIGTITTQSNWLKKQYYPLWKKLHTKFYRNSHKQINMIKQYLQTTTKQPQIRKRKHPQNIQDNNSKWSKTYKQQFLNTMLKDGLRTNSKKYAKQLPVDDNNNHYKLHNQINHKYRQPQVNKSKWYQRDATNIAPNANIRNSKKETMVKYENKSNISLQSSLPLSQEKTFEIKVGKKELGAILGTSGTLILLISIIAITVTFHKRCLYTHHKKKSLHPHRPRIRKLNNDIILAYESSEADSSQSISGISSITLNEENSTSYLPPHPFADINNSFDNMPKRSLIEQMDLLKTIDERPEDIYSHLKNSKPKWLQKMLSKKSATTSTNMHMSKSADNLSDLYPSLERNLKVRNKNKAKKKHHKRSTDGNIRFLSKSYNLEIPVRNQNYNEDRIELTGALYDSITGESLHNLSSKRDTPYSTYGSLTTKSKSEPDIIIEHESSVDQTADNTLHSHTIIADEQQNKEQETFHQRVQLDEFISTYDNNQMLQSHQIGGDEKGTTCDTTNENDDTLDTDNMSSIIDFTAAPDINESVGTIPSCNLSDDDPSSFTHVSNENTIEKVVIDNEEQYASIDELSMDQPSANSEPSMSYEGIYQQIPADDLSNVVLTSFSSNSDHDHDSEKGQKVENPYKRSIDIDPTKYHIRYTGSKNEDEDHYDEINDCYKNKYSIKIPNGKSIKANRTENKDLQISNNRTKPKIKKHRRSNSEYDLLKHKSGYKQMTYSVDSLQEQQPSQKIKDQHRVHFQTPPKYNKKTSPKTLRKDLPKIISKKQTSPLPFKSNRKLDLSNSVDTQNHKHILNLLKQCGGQNNIFWHLIGNDPQYSHVDFSTMNSQNELTSDSLDLSFITKPNKSHSKDEECSFDSTQRHDPVHTDHFNNSNSQKQTNNIKHGKTQKRKSESGISEQRHQQQSTYHHDLFVPYPDPSNGFPSNFSSLKRTSTLNGQHNWSYTYEIQKEKENLQSKKARVANCNVDNHYNNGDHNIIQPANTPLNTSWICGIDTADRSFQSQTGSQRSKKSHATLYNDISDFEGIYMPKEIAHALGDVPL